MLQLYGNPKSRAMRRLWMLEEMSEPCQLIEKSTRSTISRAPILTTKSECSNSDARGW